MRTNVLALALLAAAGLASPALAQEAGPIVITEIMYNPHGVDEGQEWVEIYNPTNAVVDLSRWSLIDDDGRTDDFATGTTLAPHAIAVIVPRRGGVNGNGTGRKSTYVNTQASWDAAWGPGIQIIWVESFWNYPADPVPVTGTIDGLSNAPSATNELLTLVDRARVVIDQMSYDDDEGLVTTWPDDNDGGSIQLLRDFTGDLIANNNGAAWRLSGPGDGLGSRLGNTALPAFPGLVSRGTPGQLPTQTLADCNGNGINDPVDIVNGTAIDSYPYNNIPDSCEGDCNSDALPDLTQIALDWRRDRNANLVLDACEINGAGGIGGVGGVLDANANGVLDSFENTPNVLISEILYNPAGDDEGKEFVEIYNAGTTAVDVSGWRLRDLEGDPATGPIPAGTILQSHEAIVLMPGSGPTVPADNLTQFRAAWNLPVAVRAFALNPWQDRAQQATAIEEVLALVDASGQPVDVVDYENLEFLAGSVWPQDDGVSSIALLPSAISKTANDSGDNWRLAISHIDGAYDSVQTGFHTDLRQTGSTGSPGIVWTAPHQTPGGEAVLTEIMANPNSDSGDGTRNEWVEVFNPGPTELDLSGWYLRDEDGRTGPIPDGTVLASQQAMVLIPTGSAASADVAQSDFRSAWGNLCLVIALPGWSDAEPVPNLGSLANSPSQGNEILTLRRGDGTVVDIVNFDDDGVVWPSDAVAALPGLGTGWSIYLLPGHYSGADNDLGQNWGGSIQGIDLAELNLMTPVFNGFDLGSPGALAGTVAPPCGCLADYNHDGFVDGIDYDQFNIDFESLDPVQQLRSDVNGDGFVDGIDYDQFNFHFETGC